MQVAQTELKLNLGSRDRRMEGWVNVDTEAHPGVDFVHDCSDLSYLPGGSVSEIYASHVLEHFPHVQSLQILGEWHRALRPGGILYLAVPDFSRAVELYMRAGMADWIVNFLWGDQGYPGAFHKTGFDFRRIECLLKQSGFSDISQVDQFPLGDKNDCSRKISTLDLLPVSLNVVAVKSSRSGSH